MSKGDSVEVIYRNGSRAVIVATKRGRRLEQKRTAAWLVVHEVTQNGRPTGNRLEARMPEVSGIGTSKVEP